MGLKSYFKVGKPAKADVEAAEPKDAIVIKSASPSSSKAESLAESDGKSDRSLCWDEIKYEVMCNWIFQQQCVRMWVSEFGGTGEGTLVKRSTGSYICFPEDIMESTFAQAAEILNVNVSASELCHAYADPDRPL